MLLKWRNKKKYKNHFLKILCRVLWENARRTYMFVVRHVETHNKYISLLCVSHDTRQR
jgi:hypothetical protein